MSMNEEQQQNQKALPPVIQGLTKTYWDFSLPPTEEYVLQAEERLGFALPPLLRRIYREVGNGWQLSALHEGAEEIYGEGDTLVSKYLRLRQYGYVVPELSQVPIAWPTGLLPFWSWGCAIYSCVDCLSTENPVIFWDQYREEQFFIQRPSLALWLEDLQSGVDLFSEMYPKEAE
jgi:hypothetical protein